MFSPRSQQEIRRLCCSHTMEHCAERKLCCCVWMTSTGGRIPLPFEQQSPRTRCRGRSCSSHPTWTRLKEYLEEDRATLAAAYGAEADGPLFLSDSHRNPGQPLSKWTVKDIFDRISDALQIPQLTPHKMRHLMLTELKKSGMDLLDVSRYARHRTIASTEIYLHTDISDLRTPGQQSASAC